MAKHIPVDFTKIKIDKNVFMPAKGSTFKCQFLEFLSKLSEGDSFVLSNPSSYSRLREQAKEKNVILKGMKIYNSEEQRSEFRVWRIANA